MQFKNTAKILLMLPIFLAVFLFAGNVFASEKINNFDAQITVGPDGVVNVVETIEYDFGTEQKHGIYRDIPMGNIYTIEHSRLGGTRIDVGSVTDEKGNSYQRDVTDKDGVKSIKIGDPDKTITGVHKYIINYTVKNALGYFADYDEIYWNVTGNGWQVPIMRASAMVKLPGDVQGLTDKIQCYTGFEGDKNICDSVIPYHYSSAQFVQNNIMPGQGLTVAVGFAKGLVPNYTYVAKWYNDPNNYYKIAFGVFILGLLLLLRKIFFVYIPEIREKTKPIIAQFEPPAGMTPSEVGYTYKATYAQDNRSLSGDILYLATEGYIKIGTSEKKFSVFNVLKYMRGFIFFLAIVSVIVFFSGEYLLWKFFGGILFFTFLINFIAHKGSVKKMFTVVNSAFTRTDKDIAGAKDHIVSLYNLITKTSGTKTLDELVAEQPYYEFQNYFEQARIFLPIGNNAQLGKIFTIGGFAKSMLKGFGAVFSSFFKIVATFFVLFVLIAGANIISQNSGVSLLIVSLPLIVLVLFFVLNRIAKYFYKKRLEKTSDEYYRVMGLRQYIKIAEKDRLLFENKPEDLPKIFSKLLPFAVALGLGDVWAKAFNGLITTNPEWYHGTTNSFSSMAFAASISGFSSGISSAASSGAPSSSGGSSGGGSSGGGGGGGGGGSW